MKQIVVDLDNTITVNDNSPYSDKPPNIAVIEMLRTYQTRGFSIVISTARNMRTYEGNEGKIIANTVPVILEWLAKHDVPYDELRVGKPWCGTEGFYVDDKSIRPQEFTSLSYEEIIELING
ncbi:MAG: capsular biosynthesis protein [Rhodobacteraceae bacterium]|nr:capsular biosynthesis protein [Paracoccaceae bacterium]